jgi:hypothetical protein
MVKTEKSRFVQIVSSESAQTRFSFTAVSPNQFDGRLSVGTVRRLV